MLLRRIQLWRLERFWQHYSNARHYGSTSFATINDGGQHASSKDSNIESEEHEDSNTDDARQQSTDAFTEEFLKNRIELTTLQKLILSTGSSLAALIDPRRHDMIACLGETTGEAALENMLQIMRNSEEGERILTERPRINTSTIDLDELRTFPEDTLGFAYVKFLQDNNVTPDSRMEVRFMSDPDLAYIMTRYRECHDLVHTILDMPTNMLGEVAVKWVEALNNGLPMCYGGAIFGALRLRPKQRKDYMKRYLPWAIRNGRSMKPLINVYWEERWKQNVADLRKELNIRTLN